MQNKKNPKADIGRNSSIYFALGLALMMFMSYATINYKVYDKDATGIDRVNMDALDEEEVPITEQVKPPPPPPPPYGAGPAGVAEGAPRDTTLDTVLAKLIASQAKMFPKHNVQKPRFYLLFYRRYGLLGPVGGG